LRRASTRKQRSPVRIACWKTRWNCSGFCNRNCLENLIRGFKPLPEPVCYAVPAASWDRAVRRLSKPGGLRSGAQSFTAPCAARVDDGTAAPGCHARPETMSAGPFQFAWLKSTFHFGTSGCSRPPFTDGRHNRRIVARMGLSFKHLWPRHNGFCTARRNDGFNGSQVIHSTLD